MTATLIIIWFICSIFWIIMCISAIVDHKPLAAITYGLLTILCFILTAVSAYKFKNETLDPTTVIIIKDVNETEIYEDATISRKACYVVTDKDGNEHLYSTDVDYIRKDK